MNLIIPKDLLPYIDEDRSCMSRASYLIKCVAYIQAMGITVEQIDSKLAAKYERANNDRIDRIELEGEGRDQSTM